MVNIQPKNKINIEEEKSESELVLTETPTVPVNGALTLEAESKDRVV
jgi:hypothetical protein